MKQIIIKPISLGASLFTSLKDLLIAISPQLINQFTRALSFFTPTAITVAALKNLKLTAINVKKYFALKHQPPAALIYTIDQQSTNYNQNAYTQNTSQQHQGAQQQPDTTLIDSYNQLSHSNHELEKTNAATNILYYGGKTLIYGGACYALVRGKSTNNSFLMNCVTSAAMTECAIDIADQTNKVLRN